MRDILLLEVPDGFIVQGLVTVGASTSPWSDTVGSLNKETLSFLDDDIARFMEEASARRGTSAVAVDGGGMYEKALRVIGHWLDGQKPKDVFLFEQGGAYVVRILVGGQSGGHHELAEFTKDDVDQLLSHAPELRAKPSGIS